MTDNPMFSDAIRATQTRLGSRQAMERREQRGWSGEIDEKLAMFIATRDSIYLGSASRDGQPYIQHRGGPIGFLRVVGPSTIGFADFAGNRQYISMGNLSENPKAFIFMMDYETQQRIKLWGTARFVEDDPELVERLAVPGYAGKPERAFLFDIAAWDSNCRQHIMPRIAWPDLEPVLKDLKGRIAELEAEISRLKGEGQT